MVLREHLTMDLAVSIAISLINHQGMAKLSHGVMTRFPNVRPYGHAYTHSKQSDVSRY